MPLLFDVIKLPNEALQEAATECLSGMLTKGMEASTKLHVIQKMGIVACCARFKDGLPGSIDSELRIKCAKLLGTLCTEILEIMKKVENSAFLEMAGSPCCCSLCQHEGLQAGHQELCC